MSHIRYWDIEEVKELLVGNSVTDATDDTLTLSNGTQLRFDRENSDCCSYVELVKLNTVPNIITAAFVEDDEGHYGEGPYKAWIRVVTEAGELNVAELDGDASNGYYLHGFALSVEVIEAADAA